MKKLIGVTLVAVSLMWVTPGVAQVQGSAGLFGGLNLADLGGDDVTDTSILLGGMGGGFVSIAVHPVVSIGFTGFYSMQGAKDSATDEKVEVNNINFAPYLGVSPPVSEVSPVRPVFYLGPELGLNVSCTDTDGEDCKDQTKSASFGLLFGASLLIQNRFFTGVGYTLGLTTAAEDPDDVKHKVIHFYAGVSFPFGGVPGM